jgi:hypothetical protein
MATGSSGRSLSKLGRSVALTLGVVGQEGGMIKVSPARRCHILDGDATGGGHGPGRGLSGRSEFPATLTDDEIIAGIETIANDPANYLGGTIPATPGRFKISGDLKGVKTIVIVDPFGGDVITAWPEGVPRNP